MKSQFKIVLLILAALLLAACTKDVKKDDGKSDAMAGAEQSTQPADQGSGIAEEGAFTPADLASNACLKQTVIYFDFDQDTLRPEYQAVLACHSKYLRDRPGAQMRLEGHADERGTREYNLGLGERRANGVSSAFNASGADVSRITVISYGEERPLCLDTDESCWSRNRRVEIVYSVK